MTQVETVPGVMGNGHPAGSEGEPPADLVVGTPQQSFVDMLCKAGEELRRLWVYLLELQETSAPYPRKFFPRIVERLDWAAREIERELRAPRSSSAPAVSSQPVEDNRRWLVGDPLTSIVAGVDRAMKLPQDAWLHRTEPVQQAFDYLATVLVEFPFAELDTHQLRAARRALGNLAYVMAPASHRCFGTDEQEAAYGELVAEIRKTSLTALREQVTMSVEIAVTIVRLFEQHPGLSVFKLGRDLRLPRYTITFFYEYCQAVQRLPTEIDEVFRWAAEGTGRPRTFHYNGRFTLDDLMAFLGENRRRTRNFPVKPPDPADEPIGYDNQGNYIWADSTP